MNYKDIENKPWCSVKDKFKNAKFRKQIETSFRQHTFGNMIFEDYFDNKSHGLEILSKRFPTGAMVLKARKII